jgi:VWFA-related protein
MELGLTLAYDAAMGRMIFGTALLLAVTAVTSLAQTPSRPEDGFVAPAKYTNAFFGFSLPLPRDADLRILPKNGDPREPFRHLLFLASSGSKGYPVIAVLADETSRSGNANPRKAVLALGAPDVDLVQISGQEFSRGTWRKVTVYGAIYGVGYAAVLKGYVLYVCAFSFDRKALAEIERSIRQLTLFDPASAEQQAGPASQPYEGPPAPSKSGTTAADCHGAPSVTGSGSCWPPSTDDLIASSAPSPPDAAASSSTIFITAVPEDATPAGLSTADIQIKVDGKSVTVQEVRRVAETPLRYCLLFDSSGSRRDRFKLQQDEAAELLSKVVKAGSDHGILVAFNSKYYLDGEGTDPRQFVNRITTERPEGGTAFYDAAITSANYMSKNAPSPGPRVMFIFSDGEDNASVKTEEAAELALLKAGIKVYVIGQVPLNPPHSSRAKAARSLRELAERTGGKAYFPEQKDVGAVVADISNELHNLFAVTVALPEEKNGQLHKLEVECSKKDVPIRAADRYATPLP